MIFLVMHWKPCITNKNLWRPRFTKVLYKKWCLLCMMKDDKTKSIHHKPLSLNAINEQNKTNFDRKIFLREEILLVDCEMFLHVQLVVNYKKYKAASSLRWKCRDGRFFRLVGTRLQRSSNLWLNLHIKPIPEDINPATTQSVKK